MKEVMAQGTFDLIHPGHIHYLKKSAELGGKLTVVIACDSRVEKDTYFSEKERKEIVDNLKPVDKAVVGNEGSIYRVLKEIKPDVITLGHDQEHDQEQVKQMAEEVTGHEVEVSRISKKGDYSSSKIRDH